MKSRSGASRRTFEVVRKRKAAPQGRHLTWRARTPAAEPDLSGLILYGQA